MFPAVSYLPYPLMNGNKALLAKFLLLHTITT